MLRPGVFTGTSGRETVFTPGDIAGIVARFTAGYRPNPPITERHDYGRAVGRVADVWADSDGNLYGRPRWNSAGLQLLTDEVYDGFSCELEWLEDGWALIGGSLTNYPAVDGLQPVTLSAPPPAHTSASDLPAAAPAVSTPPTKETRMSETPDQALEQLLQQPIPEAPAVNDTAMQAQINAYVAQMEMRFKAQQDAAFARAQAEFERRITDMERRRAIEAYAQHITTPTLSRPHALPGQAETYITFLSSLSGDQRTAAQGLFDSILTGGLVSYEELGSDGDSAPEQGAAEQFQAAVTAKLGTGLSRLAAMQAVAAEQPALYAAYQAESSQRGRAAYKGGK
jgi:hypothetical protein